MDHQPQDPALTQLRQQIREDIQASAAETRQWVQGLVTRESAETRQWVQGLVTRESAETRQWTEQLISTSSAETRRHFDVVAEGLFSKVQLVAEGLAMLDEKVERFRDEVRSEFRSVDQRFLRLEARVAALERR